MYEGLIAKGCLFYDDICYPRDCDLICTPIDPSNYKKAGLNSKSANPIAPDSQSAANPTPALEFSSVLPT